MICMSRRRRRNPGLPARSTSWPSKYTPPEAASTSRSNILPSVLLPEPDSPTSPSVSPASIASETSLTARTRVVALIPKADCPERKVLVKRRASTRGMVAMVTNGRQLLNRRLRGWRGYTEFQNNKDPRHLRKSAVDLRPNPALGAVSAEMFTAASLFSHAYTATSLSTTSPESMSYCSLQKTEISIAQNFGT